MESFFHLKKVGRKCEALATFLKSGKGRRFWAYMRCLPEEGVEAVPLHEERRAVLLADRRAVSGGAAPRAEPCSDRCARNTG